VLEALLTVAAIPASHLPYRRRGPVVAGGIVEPPLTLKENEGLT
jgi:hypothetical protein